jgi:hypothetical protein
MRLNWGHVCQSEKMTSKPKCKEKNDKLKEYEERQWLQSENKVARDRWGYVWLDSGHNGVPLSLHKSLSVKNDEKCKM